MKILSDITINQYKLRFIGFVDYVGLSFMCLYRLVDYSKLRDITVTGEYDSNRPIKKSVTRFIT